MSLSVALAVYNEAVNLDACLSSVSGLADEIIVVDGGSTDNTTKIAGHYKARIIRTSNPPIFHINKQKALEASKGDWILQLDADEIVPSGLADEIRSIINSRSTENGYYIPRKNYFWGRVMSKGGQYPDYVIRLVRRGKAHFPCKTVHEQIEVAGKTGYLVQPLLHYSYRTFGDYWKKANHYINLTADTMKRNKVSKSPYSMYIYMIDKPVRVFLSLYFRHLGLMDGWRGFIFAVFSALHYPLAYKKYALL